MKGLRILGIDVPAELLDRWRSYLAPQWQPFFVASPGEWDAPEPPATTCLSDELRDTFKTWRMNGPSSVVWFDEPAFMALPRGARARLVREQVQRNRGAVPTVRRWQNTFDATALRAHADSHRFVWWPSLLHRHAEAVLSDHVLDGQQPSRHTEVKASTWRGCEGVLPRAREIAGTFPASSGPNCFATTLGAAGCGDAQDWVQREPFEAFLTERCERGGVDGDAGTVLVWRDRDGQAVHSAVTLGDGWALEKPAQTWWTARVVLEVRQLIKANRWPGQRLERHRIVVAR